MFARCVPARGGPARLLVVALCGAAGLGSACGSDGQEGGDLRDWTSRPPFTSTSRDASAGADVEATDTGTVTADAGAGAPDAEETLDASPADGGVEPDGGTAPDAAVPADGGRALFLAVGGGVRRVISRDGVTWTNNAVVDPRGGDDDNNTRGAAWGDGRFVIGGGANTGFTMTSVDGITWTGEARNLRSFVSQPAFGNNVWVAVGGNGFRVRSLDGVTWVDDTGYYEGHFRRVAFGRGAFVAVGHTYGSSNVGLIGRSTDGRSWTTTPQPGTTPLWDVAFGNDVFVATGPDRAARSPDGITWTPIAITTAGIDSVSFAGGEHLITAREGLWRSIDGVQWTRIDGFAPRFIAFGGGVYLGVDGDGRRHTSADRTNWTRGVLDGPGLNDIVVGDVP